MEKLTSLNNLYLEYNNITDYLQMINFETLQNLKHLNICNNSVTQCEQFRYFVFYRFSNLLQFNDFDKTEGEVEKTKEIYLEFDKILQKLHKLNNQKYKIQNQDKQVMSKKIAENFIQNQKNKIFLEKNFENVFDEYIDSYLQQIFIK